MSEIKKCRECNADIHTHKRVMGRTHGRMVRECSDEGVLASPHAGRWVCNNCWNKILRLAGFV